MTTKIISMIDVNASNELILAEIEKAANNLEETVQPLSEEEFNAVPFQNSWTAAQVLIHLTKSARGISRIMKVPAPTSERDPREKVPEFQKVFLNFSTKFKSPEFILPEEKWFQKDAVLINLHQAYLELKNSLANEDLNGLLKNLPMGETTKIELLHFVLYHLVRHLHQLENICKALKTLPVNS